MIPTNNDAISIQEASPIGDIGASPELVNLLSIVLILAVKSATEATNTVIEVAMYILRTRA